MVLYFCSVMVNELFKVFFVVKKKRFLYGLFFNVNVVEIGIFYVVMCIERFFLLLINVCFINKIFFKI